MYSEKVQRMERIEVQERDKEPKAVKGATQNTGTVKPMRAAA